MNVRKLIAMGGGFEVSQLYPFVTHVISETCTPEEFMKFNESRSVYVVNDSWLYDSLKFKNKVLESDYHTPVKNPENKKAASASVMLAGSGFRLLSSNQKPKKGEVDETKKSEKIKKRARELKFVSPLFKNLIFYVPKGFGLSEYRISIIEHSGSVLEALPEKRKMRQFKGKIYGVYKDGVEPETYQLLGNLGVSPVSTRWIDFCISRGFVLKNPTEEKMYHLLPFPIRTPVKQFSGITIKIKGFNLDKMKSLTETAKIIGFSLVDKVDDAKLVVLEKAKYREVRKQVPEEMEGKVVKKESWLISLINTGKFSDEDKKLILSSSK